MSDFDKEAEREKLREKYGQEEEKRKATEQMSELLLKGATMTNAHCTDCGDPIFRYDGQEFCPTCQKPVARDQSAGDGDADDRGDHIEVADPSDDATVQFGDGAAADAATEDAADAQADSTESEPTPAADAQTDPAETEPKPAADKQTEPAETEPTPATDPTRTIPSGDPGRTQPSGDGARDRAETPSEPTTDRRPAPESPRGGHAGESVTAELSAAESLLAETVHRFAQRAADTDDPRTAREHLSAAREAAEALDAVRF
ncbi:hypothetical protein NDI56_12495 [Haloarcula sp. S1CR25-12]|uniref:Sjogren's syndrome/scleroderma autoantigen 1 (Autoantigen p27) n=1 Tax=Haloarcula saliterrae TaxID=2950534 RepID=A0ABU2FEG7_9EURY|nr:Sjogren's syndrome/scleroderma autoantigen 1 family protein [Haloarcula sp. S1CR25-12]MDS0260215.1 hypothetical protein [Haloarcula sp. S1CR25-12]